MDGERAQEPVVLGSLPGVPVDAPDASRGFNDPNGVYPLNIKMPDTNVAAREETAQAHISRLVKNANRVENISAASAPKLSTIIPDKDDAGYYSYVTWSEPKAANDEIPQYPHNHVFETENGHLQEFDDTEGKERYHRFHPSGSYEEIVADGSRTIKVIGKDYELYMDGVNMYILGDLNVTVQGNKRETITGNYHLQVGGETTISSTNSFHHKIGGSYMSEIGYERSVSVDQNDYLAVLQGDMNYTCPLGAWDMTLGIGGLTLNTLGGVDITSALGQNYSAATNITATAALTMAFNAGVLLEYNSIGAITSECYGYRQETTLLYKNETVGGALTTGVGGAIQTAAAGIHTLSAGGIMTLVAPLINLNPL
jgi:hypothetical protein